MKYIPWFFGIVGLTLLAIGEYLPRFELKMLGVVVVASVIFNCLRKNHNQRTGEAVTFLQSIIDPGLVVTHEPFNGYNGVALVGAEWLLPIVGVSVSMWWAATGDLLPGVLAAVTFAVTITVGIWRVCTGRTSDSPWRAAGRRPTVVSITPPTKGDN